MTTMDPEKVQQMQAGYEARIQRQKESIGRLQDMIADLEDRLRVSEAARTDYKQAWDKADQKVSQLTADVRKLQADLNAAYARMESPAEPTGPSIADVTWDRRVPERPEGPIDSGSDEVLEFDAWGNADVMPPEELRPSRAL